MGKSSHYTGTMAPSTMATHGGKVAGAGELGSGGPGKAAMHVKSSSSVKFDENASGKKPSGMRKANQG